MPRFADPPKPWRGGAALRDARTCYDHLAGRLGVALADALTRQGYARITPSGAELTQAGTAFLATHDIAPVMSQRSYCRSCLDWSERRPHLAGAVGAALATHAFDKGWVTRVPGGRALTVTKRGQQALAEIFAVDHPQ